MYGHYVHENSSIDCEGLFNILLLPVGRREREGRRKEGKGIREGKGEEKGEGEGKESEKGNEREVERNKSQIYNHYTLL